jgi:hypothetical protein
MAASRGEWVVSALYHPLGLLLVVGGWLAALWLTVCAITGRDLGLRRVYRVVNSRAAVLAGIVLLAVIWVWQIWVAAPLWPHLTP